jgi:hypothetical protein
MTNTRASFSEEQETVVPFFDSTHGIVPLFGIPTKVRVLGAGLPTPPSTTSATDETENQAAKIGVCEKKQSHEDR